MESPWLDDRQQHLWRAWLAVGTQLSAAMDRQLAADASLSLTDFEVLVHLSESPDARARIRTLTESLGWERSRVSHQVGRMAARGLLAREACEEDGRGSFVVLTAHGRDTLAEAAPEHARMVKRLLFADVPEQERDAVQSFLTRVLERLEAEASPTG